jgi:hypothetical protein
MLKLSNKKTEIIIIIAIILIINIVFTSLIFSDLLGLEAPEITIKINVVDVSDENIVIESILLIQNPNSFTTELTNFELQTTTDSGYEIGKMSIPDTMLPSMDIINISSNTVYSLNGEPFHILHNKITGSLQVNLLGIIKKNLPVSVTISTNPTTLIDAIALPQISANIASYNLTNYGLTIEGTMDIINTNSIGFFIDNPKLTFSDEDVTTYGTVSISSISIPPNKKISQPFIGNISYDIFNKGTLKIILTGDTDVMIGGFVKKMPFNTTTSISIPDLQSFLLYNENLSITLFADADFTLAGVNAEIGVIYYNPTEIPFKAYNLTMRAYRLYDSYKTLLAEDTKSEQYYPPKSETILSSNFNLTYLEFFPDFTKGPTKWLELYLYAEFAIGETNQRIPVTIRGLISPSMIGAD